MSRGGRGRGRGRGRGGSFAGTLEAIGLSPGDSVPPPILQPPPLFPNLNRCPLPLDDSSINQYLVTVKQEFRNSMMQSPFHLKLTSSNAVVIQRYSDASSSKRESSTNGKGWKISWRFFPDELKPGKKLKKVIKTSSKKRTRKDTNNGKEDEEADNVHRPNKRKHRQVTFEEDEEEGDGSKLSKNLEKLESLEQHSGESEQSGEETIEEVYEEEEEEEGTDYNLTYFDNGEDYEVGDDDALEDGPVY